MKLAREGTQTQETALIKFNKVGKLVEDNINQEYYSQTYSVSSDVSMKSYTITSIKNFTQNTMITDINNKEKNSFNANEQFKVLIPKSEIASNSDINGIIHAQMKCQTYPIFYGKKNNQLQPYALTYDTYGENIASTTLQVKMNTGKIQVTKIDSETKEPIEGVTFQLTKTDGTIIAKEITNKEGIASFSNLYEGEYQLQEVETNQNYLINSTPFDVEVQYDKTTEIEVENQFKKGQIKIIKVDENNSEIKLKDVEFEVIDQNGNVLETIKTDENGEGLTKQYPLSDFESLTIKEVKTKEGYILNEMPQTITLEANKIVEAIFTNKKIPEEPPEKPKEPEKSREEKSPPIPQKKLPKTGF